MGWLPPGGVYTLEPGDKLRIGEAYIEYGGDGVLVAGDRYGERRVFLDGVPVRVYPVQPLNRPRRLTSCLALGLDAELVLPGEPRCYWFRAPVELAVAAGGVVIAHLSPLMVKHTLVGEIVDGVVCRFYRTGVYREPPKPSEGEALVMIRFRQSPSIRLQLVVFPIDTADIYVDSNGVPYYEAVEAAYTGGQVAFKLTDQPPRNKLQLIREARVAKPFQKRVFLYKP